jgi:tetratricopeptide (TPR) repeat protein
MPKTINLYIVYTNELVNRTNNINNVVDVIKKLCDKNDIHIINNIIKDPTSKLIDDNINLFNDRVDYSKFEENNEYNDSIDMLNTSQISNYEKHRELYKIIKDKDDTSLHMIIEDDILVSNAYVNNIEEFLNYVKDDNNNIWDLLFLSLNNINSEEKIVNYRKVYNKLVTKCCYLIKPKICEKLYNHTNKFKMTIRNTLSKYITDNTDLNVYFFNKVTFIEGSKLGLFPSTTNNVNYLYFNNEYIELVNIYNKDVLTNEDILRSGELFKQAENLKSSDVYNIMGMIHNKKKNYKEAKQYFTTALELHKKNFGYLQKNSIILNNAIDVFKYDQDMLEDCIKAKPKYS